MVKETFQGLAAMMLQTDQGTAARQKLIQQEGDMDVLQRG